MTFEELMAKIDKRAEDRRASDRAVAKAAGMTIEEFDADTTAPDPRPEDETADQPAR